MAQLTCPTLKYFGEEMPWLHSGCSMGRAVPHHHHLGWAQQPLQGSRGGMNLWNKPAENVEKHIYPNALTEGCKVVFATTSEELKEAGGS